MFNTIFETVSHSMLTWGPHVYCYTSKTPLESCFTKIYINFDHKLTLVTDVRLTTETSLKHLQLGGVFIGVGVGMATSHVAPVYGDLQTHTKPLPCR